MATFYSIMLYGGLALAIIFAIVTVILFFKLNIPKVLGDITGRTAKKQIEEIREKGYESSKGSGTSKKDSIKKSTSKISVRDIKTSNEDQIAAKGKENYEKAKRELDRRRNTANLTRGEEETSLLGSHGKAVDEEAATDILTEGTPNHSGYDIYDDEEGATDVLTLTEDDEAATDVLTSEDEEGATDVLTSTEEEGATDVLTSGDEDGATDVLTSGGFDAMAAAGGPDSYSDDDSEYESTDVLANPTYVRTSTKVKIITDIVVTHTDETI